MLWDALSYPRRNESWLKTILIGGILSFFGFLILPALVVQGYYVRVIRSAAMDEGMDAGPVFDDWGNLLLDGLKAFLVILAYVGIPQVVLVGVVGVFAGSETEGPSLVGSVLLIVTFVILLVALFLTPVALTNFAVTDRVGAAFDFGAILDAGFTGQYAVAFVLAIVLAGTLGLLAGVLTLLVVGIFLGFYVQIAVNYLLGRGCGPTLVESRAERARAD